MTERARLQHYHGWSSALIVTLFMLWTGSALAQTQYEHLLRGPFLDFNSPTITMETLGTEQIYWQSEIQRALKEVMAREKTMEGHRLEIEDLGHTSLSFFQKVQGHVHTVNKETEEYQERDARIQGQIHMALGLVNDHFEELDKFIQDYLDVVMALGLHLVRNDLIELKAQGKKPSRKKRRLYNKMLRERDRYLENKHEYQQPKDTRRTTPYHNFFRTMRDYYDDSGFSPLTKLKGLVRTTINGLRMAPAILSAVKVLILNSQPTNHRTPLAQAVFKAVSKIGEVRGLNVTVQGSEYLQDSSDPNRVRVFTASHREGLNDIITTAALKLDSMIIFAAVNNFVPEFLNSFFRTKDRLIKRLNRNLGLIVVGKGADPAPIEKALQIVETSKVRDFLIFPGGRLPEGLGATMGVREKTFSEEGLVSALEDAGYRVELVPLAMPDNARLFGRHLTLHAEDNPNLRVQVFPNIDHETRQYIMDVGGSKALDQLLRFGLTETLTTDFELIWGQVRAAKIPEVLSRFVFGSSAYEPLCDLAFSQP